MMSKNEFRRVCEDYANGKDFVLNPDSDFLEKVLDGVMKKQEQTGLRLCPCRLGTGDLEKDWELLCPCFFQKQEKWRAEGTCWCGLFVRK